MAKLEENIFKPEEELQGYTAGEADADTFLLAENDEYPGMVPDFGSAPEQIEVKPEVAVFEDKRTEEIEEEDIEEIENIEEFVAPQDIANENIEEELDLNIDIDDDDLSDVWSAFGAPDDDEEEEIPDKAGIEEDEEVIPEKAGIETTEEVLPDKAGIETAEELIPDKAGIETTEEMLPDKAGIETTEEATQTKATAASAIDVDEFKQFLEAQKEKTQAQRKAAEEEEAVPNRDSTAEPVFVEITGDDFQEKKKTPEPEKKQEKPKKEKPEKEEKKRKGIAGWLVAASLLILIGLFTAALMITENDKQFLKLVSSMTDKVQGKTMPTDSTQTDETVAILEDTLQKEEEVVDFSDTTQDEITEETVEIAENIPETKPETKQAPIKEKVATKQQTQKTRAVAKENNTKPAKQIIANNVQETESGGVIKRVYEPEDAAKEKFASLSTVNNIATPSAKESMIVRTNSTVETEKTKPKVTKQGDIERQTLPSLDRNKGVFSVQVYSTLSKKDATDKVKQLQNMNIKNVYISEYRKRDVLWYRVRYGEFESYEQAQKEARNRGFSEAWIDRIK